MADSSSTPLFLTSTPPTDSLFHSDPPYSVPNPAGSPHLPRCLPGAYLSGGSGGSGGSGRVPANVNGQSGSGTGAASSSCSQQCKMVEVHGVKVASFPVNGVDLICLPQVFELFLKHLVGGLHTVYTKLKRLDICPVVCTVEQVRALRGLGAIQPGVNRCKLITRADFETLYRDCTNASSRPGRPPKRTLGSRLLPHGLIGPAPLLTHTGLTAAMAEALKLQKMRMMMGFHGNSDQQHRQSNDGESENEDTGGSEASWEKEQRLLSPLQQHRMSDFPFMVMPHPLLPVGLPPASVAMAMNQMSQLSEFANMAALSHVQTEDSKESPPGSPSPCPSLSEDELRRGPTSQSASRASSSSSSSPLDGGLAETEDSGDTALKETDDCLMPRPLLKMTNEKLPLASQPLSINHANPGLAPFLLAEGLSSMETLLTNIQGLLKGALDSARCHTEQSRVEKTELKLQVERERDARYTLQRQLSTELQATVWIQRRLKKEKKAKRKLQEELELHRRTVIPEKEKINQQETSAAQENKPPL